MSVGTAAFILSIGPDSPELLICFEVVEARSSAVRPLDLAAETADERES